MAKKFYAVKEGKKTGIFTSWDKTKEYVTGVNSAVYKGFNNLSDAKAFLGISEDNSTTDAEKNNTLTAYVDGSYTGGNEFGCGVVIIENDEVTHTISEKKIDADLAEMRNVAGEITAAKIAMEYATNKGYKAITIYHDYKGIADWCTGEWKAKKAGTKDYKAFYDSIKDKLTVTFVKVTGHSGNKYNDLADKLAGEAIGIK